MYDASGTVKTVPGSKEDVFKNKDMSLVDKRRLMRFLMFAAGDFEDRSELEGRADLPFPEFLKAAFSLNDEIAAAITYSLTYCVSPSGRCCFRVTPFPLLRSRRPHPASAPSHPSIFTRFRTLRPLPVPRRPLRWGRRHRARLLPLSCCQWRSVYSRKTDHFHNSY